MNSDLDNAAARQSGLFKKPWRRFNRWRRRYLGVRLFFLVVFLGYACHEAFWPVSPRLNWIAVRSIQAHWEPRLVDALARFRRVGLARRLQLSLRRAADRNGDGMLGEDESATLTALGLDRQELEKTSVQANLAQLVDASHQTGLVPRSFTVRHARRDAWFAAVGEVEQINRAERARIDAMFKWWEMPDYTRPETWRRGGQQFLEYLHEFAFMLGRPRTVIVWLLFCFFVSLMVASLFRKGRFAVGLLTGFVLAISIIAYDFLSSGFYLPWVLSDHTQSIPWAVGAVTAFVCLSMASSGHAGKFAASKQSSPFRVRVGAAGLGFVLVVWGIARVFSGPALNDIEAIWGFLALQFPVCIKPMELWCSEYDWLLWWIWVPKWLNWTLSGIGAASLVAGLLGFVGLPRLCFKARAKGPPSREDGTHQPDESCG